MINTVRKMWTDERGQDIAEYAVISGCNPGSGRRNGQAGRFER